MHPDDYDDSVAMENHTVVCHCHHRRRRLHPRHHHCQIRKSADVVQYPSRLTLSCRGRLMVLFLHRFPFGHYILADNCSDVVNNFQLLLQKLKKNLEINVHFLYRISFLCNKKPELKR